MSGAGEAIIKSARRTKRLFTHHMALKWRLMLMLALFITVSVCVLGAVSMRIYSDSIVGQTVERRNELGASILQAVEIIRNRDDYSASSIVRNDDIMEALSYSGPQTLYLQFLEIRNCSKALMDIADKSNIVGLAVLGDNGKSFFSKSETDRTNAAALRKLTDTPAVWQSSGESVWIPSQTDIFSASGGESACLYVVKRLYSIRNANNKSVGLSVTQVQYSRLYDILSRITSGADESATIADKDGVILCTTQGRSLVSGALPDEIAKKITGASRGSFSVRENGRTVLYLYDRDSQLGWTLIQAIPYSHIADAASDVERWTLLVAAFCLAGALSLAWLFSRSFAAPVARLGRVMKKFGGGNLAARSPADRTDEIGELQNSFNGMAGQINSLLEGMEEEHRQKRTMEMRMLEYQINPHFLYNSLDSINWMAISRGNTEISEMAAALAKFFRISLSGGKETVSVADEVEHARNYLVISKIRYHDGFSFTASVDDEVRDCRTVKLIIQPLVENALVHAIHKNGEGGRVVIRACPKGENVVIEVEDNGRGIPPKRLEELRARLAKKAPNAEGDGSIGLINVQQRIRLHFGMEYGIELESREGFGTTARIVIPKAR